MGDQPRGATAEAAPGPATPPGTFGAGQLLALVRSAGRPVTIAAFLCVALVAGFLEASVILVVIAIAAGLADGSESVSLHLGPVDLSISTGEGVLVGLGLTVLLVSTAVPNAALGARMATRVLLQTRARLLRGLLEASWEQQSTVSEARFQDLAAVHAYRVGNLVLILTMFATNVLGLLALLVAALVIDLVTAGILLAIVASLAVVFRPLVTSIRRQSAAHVDAHHEYVDGVANAISVLPEIRVFGVGDETAAALERTNERTGREYRRMMFRGRLMPTLYLGATSALLLLGLAIAAGQGELSLTRIGAIVVFLLRALRYSQQVQAGWQTVMEHVPYVEQIDQALDGWRPPPGKIGRRTLGHARVLELRDVSYRYPTGEVGIEHLDLRIEPGEIVGLEGPSGAGKSTIAQLILRLRHPTTGTYLVDGVPVEEIDEASWFQRLAYVAQDPRLITGDIRDNVRFLRPHLDESAIDRALQEAGIGSDLDRWARGAGRHVGVGGRELSGGQRQRIAIARALAGSPDILVMDEPTSALDRESERIVSETLERLRGRITVVLIAHRESTLAVCDRIITVERHRASEREPLPRALAVEGT